MRPSSAADSGGGFGRSAMNARTGSSIPRRSPARAGGATTGPARGPSPPPRSPRPRPGRRVFDEPGQEVDQRPVVVAFAGVAGPMPTAPRAGGRTSSSAAARQTSTPMRQAASASGAAKKTSSPIVLTTRPPARTALVQAADSNRVRARFWSRRLIVCAQAVDPTRSTNPSATTSLGASSSPWAGRGGLSQDRAACARRCARSKASITKQSQGTGHLLEGGGGGLGQAGPGELVGALADRARSELREEECDGRFGDVVGGGPEDAA